MNLKKRYLLFTFFLITIITTLLYTNNQKTTFRYFKWTLQEVRIGNLISISFISGLFFSAFLNNTINSHKNIFDENKEEDYESLNSNEDIKINAEMPPQRDVRDAQPTISVNYRVVKNIDGDNLKSDQNFSNNPDYKDDWNDDENDW
tara:strand:- start:220 stop:660 length:441 start_codon:yes stop_codon:yes gene_type:complete